MEVLSVSLFQSSFIVVVQRIKFGFCVFLLFFVFKIESSEPNNDENVTK